MLAIGLMSGTSLDGIDAAMIESDGERIAAHLGGVTLPYDEAFRARLRACLGARKPSDEILSVESALTEHHGRAVSDLLAKFSIPAQAVELIGFHGHTLTHDPENRFTWQIGDGARLAAETGIKVVAGFRNADVAVGGEGAPLAPAYHRALAEGLETPLAILNLGGVANVTWIGSDGALLAFDTGPANALIDDWIAEKTGQKFDEKGAWAAAGTVNEAILEEFLKNKFFGRLPPKSLDRNNFGRDGVKHLSVEDGAATLSAFTVQSVVLAQHHFPAPRRWCVTGGGRHNTHLMRLLEDAFKVPVVPVEDVGWDGDLLEAEAFAFLAIRSSLGLPLSWPSTTGVDAPISGGRLFTHS
jgi:anhydro-N-acetylmuramic acid kinase